MSLVLITGGARSGKSEYAENLAKVKGGNNVTYIATSIALDEEMKDRIKKHKERRPILWETIETYKNLYTQIIKTTNEVVLIDCLTVMITNILMEVDLTWETASSNDINQIEQIISIEVEKIINAARESSKYIIVVTNEVGMGLVPEYKLGRIFRDIAGRMNKKVASCSDEVYLMVSGLPLKLK